jgi:hypothetical protein
MDLNVQTFRIVEVATSEASSKKTKLAASRKGGLKGGAARAISITPERRVEIARAASAARWKKGVSNTSAQ